MKTSEKVYTVLVGCKHSISTVFPPLCGTSPFFQCHVLQLHFRIQGVLYQIPALSLPVDGVNSAKLLWRNHRIFPRRSWCKRPQGENAQHSALACSPVKGPCSPQMKAGFQRVSPRPVLCSKTVNHVTEEQTQQWSKRVEDEGPGISSPGCDLKKVTSFLQTSASSSVKWSQ